MYKRLNVRQIGHTTSMDSRCESYGLIEQNLLGWFSTNYSAYGYIIFKPEDHEVKEFGKNSFRLYNCNHNVCSIAKFNLETGFVWFLDNDAYEEGIVKYCKGIPYRKIMIDKVEFLKEFNEQN